MSARLNPAPARPLAPARNGADHQRLLQSYAVEAWAVLDPDGRVLDRGIGRPRSGAGAWAAFERVGRESEEAFGAAVEEAMSAPGQPVELDEAVIVDADGESHQVEMVLSDLRDEPSVGGMLLVYWDIAPRLRAAAAVAFQANLLAAVAQAVVAVDRCGRVVYWNEAAAGLY
ncbi:MAG: hypothetical protein ACYDEN_14430, partial [Acidimicrobiales bacterium]